MTEAEEGYSDALYNELGRMVVTWSRVEYLLKLATARLAGVGDAGYLLTSDMTSGRAIEKTRWLAAHALEADEAQVVADWLKVVEQALQLRNALFHGAWGSQYRDGAWHAVRISVKVTKGVVTHPVTDMTLESVQAAHQACKEALRGTQDLPDALSM